MTTNLTAPDCGAPIQVRTFVSSNRQSILDLAPRLNIGMAPSRDPAAYLAAARGWIESLIARIRPDQVMFMAGNAQGRCLGFVSVGRSRHFTEEDWAYIGELVVAAEVEGRGVGRMLVAEAEAWAREQGYRTLAVETGSANLRARGFYGRLDYVDEAITLVNVFDRR